MSSNKKGLAIARPFFVYPDALVRRNGRALKTLIAQPFRRIKAPAASF
jgi:hypothetical protein